MLVTFATGVFRKLINLYVTSNYEISWITFGSPACTNVTSHQDDEHGTERLYKHSRNIQIQSTNIFDQFRSRLNEVDSNLDNLIKSSGKSSENSAGMLSDLDNRKLGLRNACENDSVGNLAKNSATSRTKPKERCKSALPSFDLGF